MSGTAAQAWVGPPSATTWGETRTFGGGLEVTVAQPHAFRASDAAAGHRPENQAVTWKITIKNDTDEAFRTTLVSVYAKYGAVGEQADRVFDSPRGPAPASRAASAPGGTATATYAFDLPRTAAASLDLEVTPDPFEYEGMHWTGPLEQKAVRG